jgi:hypothetical protein
VNTTSRPPRRTTRVVDAPDDHQRAHVDLVRVQLGQGRHRETLARAADVATQDDGSVGVAVLEQQVAGAPSCQGRAAERGL